MKIIITGLFCIYFSFQFNSSSAQVCANTANIFSFTFQAKKYEIIKEKKSWTDAAACAVLRGGYLAQINSKTEQDSIYNQIKNKAGISSSYTTVNDGGGIAYVWIGATDKKTEGVWLWDGNNDNSGANFWNGQGNAGTGTGAIVNGAFVNWGGKSNGAAKEPDNYLSNQNAAGIALASWPYGIAGEWNDIDMANTLYYVIEYDSSSTTGFNNLSNPKSDVCIYPNPATKTLSISSHQTNNRISAIEVYNTVGTLAKKETEISDTRISLDVTEINTGIYFVNIQFENGDVLTRKVTLFR